MTTRLTSAALQRAVVQRWRATSTLASACPLLDDVPQTQAFPYAVYDEPFETPDPTFGQEGQIATFTISIFTSDAATDAAGRGASGFKSSLDLAELAVAALVDPCDGTSFTPLAVEGRDVVDLQLSTLSVVRDGEHARRQLDLHFEVHVENRS